MARAMRHAACLRAAQRRVPRATCATCHATRQVSSIEEQQHALTKTLKDNAKLLEKMEATFAQVHVRAGVRLRVRARSHACGCASAGVRACVRVYWCVRACGGLRVRAGGLRVRGAAREYEGHVRRTSRLG